MICETCSRYNRCLEWRGQCTDYRRKRKSLEEIRREIIELNENKKSVAAGTGTDKTEKDQQLHK